MRAVRPWIMANTVPVGPVPRETYSSSKSWAWNNDWMIESSKNCRAMSNCWQAETLSRVRASRVLDVESPRRSRGGLTLLGWIIGIDQL